MRRHRSHHWKYVVLEKKVAVVNTDMQTVYRSIHTLIIRVIRTYLHMQWIY